MSIKVINWLLKDAITNGPGMDGSDARVANILDGQFTFKVWGVTANGDDVIINGGLGQDTDWTKGTGWTISGGVASSDGSQAGDADLTQAIAAFVTGESYEVIFTVSGYVAGNVTPVVGDTEGTDRAANGTFTETIVVGAGGDFDLRADLNFIGSVDNVSVKRINTGFNGASVDVQILAEDGVTWITLMTFSADGVKFGEVGSEEETFRAKVSGAGAGTKIHCTSTQ